MRISDWSADVCSSDLAETGRGASLLRGQVHGQAHGARLCRALPPPRRAGAARLPLRSGRTGMNELARVQKPPPPEDYYIEAETSLVDRPLLTLKQNDLFGVFNNHGDFRLADKGTEGLFFLDTRYLSQFELRLGRKPTLLLESGVLYDNSALLVALTTAEIG